MGECDRGDEGVVNNLDEGDSEGERVSEVAI